MRFLTVFIWILLFATCTSNGPATEFLANTRDTTISLKDSLGNLKITIPDRYDTFLKWTQYSDCGSCGTERYRFQPKRLPIFLESGFFWDDLKDSIDQVTVIHRQRIIYSDSSDNDFMKSLHPKLVTDARIDPLIYKNKHVFDTLQLINGKWTSLITSDYYDTITRQYSKTVWGAILLRGKLIQIQFSLLTKEKDSISENFVNKSKQMMNKVFSLNGI
ncbi:MAG TPA: hypothetical protein PKG90_12360 [Chitinophagaceae bacterium]|nr:hypothetical protein [Chitinophagaceae bacterium]HNU14559.1 hypothetical protein [Chitinophagaceae bacterium]